MEESPETPGQSRARTSFEIAKATIQRFTDGGTDRAAAMAYYAVLSLFPALLVVVLISLILSSSQAVSDAINWGVRQGLDPDLATAMDRTLQDAVARASSAAGFAAIIATITAISGASGWLAAAGRAIEPDADRRVSRNPVSAKIRFSLWTAALLVIVVTALVLLSLGGSLADTVFEWLGVAGGAPLIWSVVRPILVLVGIVGAMLLLYRVAPDRLNSPPFRHLLPGAVLAGLGWVAASAGFAFYVQNLASLGATYGAFATPIILLLWLWLSGVVVLLGASLNAELAARRPGSHRGPLRLDGADDPNIAGHPVGALPDPADDAELHPSAS